MPPSRLAKLLESSSRERVYSRTSYEVKDRSFGFRQRNVERTGIEYVRIFPAVKPSSPSDQEWRAMEDEIKSANYIVEIKSGPEPEGYVPYARETLARATDFLRRLMIHAHTANVIGTGVPRIGPAEDGSIDLFWEKDDRTLLVNFPAGESIGNYCGKKPKSEISGRFDPSESRPELVFWLAD